MTTPSQPQTHTLFFYGTLMAPSVLHRVISSTSSSAPAQNTHARTSPPLSFHPALLLSHRRRRVENADYPAVTPSPHTGSSVRGTMVAGLNDKDVAKLDLFEGDEYERRVVKVRLLPESVEDGGGVAEPLAYGGLMPVAPRRFVASETGSGVSANDMNGRGQGHEHEGVVGEEDNEEWATTQTYIWTAPESDLEEAEWDFEHFRREKLHLWAGSEARDSGMVAADELERLGADESGQPDGTRGRGVHGGEFERALKEKALKEKALKEKALKEKPLKAKPLKEKEQEERRVNG